MDDATEAGDKVATPAKPSLTLVKQPFTAEKLAELFKRLTGKEATQEEIEYTRTRLAAAQAQREQRKTE